MTEILQIEGLSDNGAAVARASDGMVVFVRGGVPGDSVRIAVDEQRGNYRIGRILELVQASSARVQPLCPYASECGGCAWQHIAYPAQLEAKRRIVADALQRIAHLSSERTEALVAAPLPSPQEYHYRNKMVLAAGSDDGGGFLLGFQRRASHSIIKPDACLLAHQGVSATPKALRGALRYAQGLGDLGIYSVSIRHSNHSGQTEVALWTDPGPFPRARVADIVGTALKATGIVRVIAERGNRGNSRAVKNVEVLAGNGAWKERLAGLKFFTSAPAFFQINSDTAELLVAEVLAGLELEGHSRLRIADLYAGGGTFTLPLARRGHELVAVENYRYSLRDLKRNAELNKLEIIAEGGDAGRILPNLGHLDALVVDPPRAGLAAPVVDAIAATAAERLIYVSCNPATWARDIVRLEQQGYALGHVQPIDQFPQTPHVELVSVLRRS
jgi:23S rRNA (uracil1939-C5)-methyltransferase